MSGERYLDVRATKALRNAFAEFSEGETFPKERDRKEVGANESVVSGQICGEGISYDKPADPTQKSLMAALRNRNSELCWQRGCIRFSMVLRGMKYERLTLSLRSMKNS